MNKELCLLWLKLYRYGGDMHTVAPKLFAPNQLVVPPKSFDLTGETIDFLINYLSQETDTN